MDSVSSQSYLASLNRSLALVLDDFYTGLPATGVSSNTGFGFDVLVPLLAVSRQEYMQTYFLELQAKKEKIAKME